MYICSSFSLRPKILWWLYHNYSLLLGHFCCLQVLAIINTASMNVFLFFIFLIIIFYLCYIFLFLILIILYLNYIFSTIIQSPYVPSPLHECFHTCIFWLGIRLHILNFSKKHPSFPIKFYQFTLLPAMYENFNCAIASPTFDVISLSF